MKKINDDVDFLKFVGKQESQYLQTKDTWRDEVLELIAGNVVALGDTLPWSKTHHCVRLRPGEVSIYAGVNGHGKSQLSGMVALWLSQHSPVVIASLEMKPERTLMRMVRQAAGCDNVSAAFAEAFLSHETDNLWIYDQLDSVEPERIIGMMHYAAQELGARHIFIDSLMKCISGTDDYNAQKDFVDRVCWLAKTENVHVHLIHHMRKRESETQRPGKFDVRGASEIVDLVDNLFIVFRNKSKEEKIRAQKAKSAPIADEVLDEADTLLTVAKQRHGEWEGHIKLWFHEKSLQYIPSRNMGPIPYRM